MKETGSSIADSSSPGAPIETSSARAYKPSPLKQEARFSRERSPLDRLSGVKANSPDSANRYGRVNHSVEESMSFRPGFQSARLSYQSFDYARNEYVPSSPFRYSKSNSLLLSPEAAPRGSSHAKVLSRLGFPPPLNVVKRESPSPVPSPSSGKPTGKRPKGARPSVQSQTNLLPYRLSGSHNGTTDDTVLSQSGVSHASVSGTSQGTTWDDFLKADRVEEALPPQPSMPEPSYSSHRPFNDRHRQSVRHAQILNHHHDERWVVEQIRPTIDEPPRMIPHPRHHVYLHHDLQVEQRSLSWLIFAAVVLVPFLPAVYACGAFDPAISLLSKGRVSECGSLQKTTAAITSVVTVFAVIVIVILKVTIR